MRLYNIMEWTRPRRRRLEAFTTDAKINRLNSRRVEFFPTAARQFFDGDCDAADLKKISPGDTHGSPTCSLLGKETEGFHIDKRAHALN